MYHHVRSILQQIIISLKLKKNLQNKLEKLKFLLLFWVINCFKYLNESNNMQKDSVNYI